MTEIKFNVKGLNSGGLSLEQLEFSGDYQSFSKVIMLLFSGDILEGIVPADIQEETNTNEEALFQEDLINKMIKERLGSVDLDKESSMKGSGDSSSKIRDVSGGITITAQE